MNYLLHVDFVPLIWDFTVSRVELSRSIYAPFQLWAVQLNILPDLRYPPDVLLTTTRVFSSISSSVHGHVSFSQWEHSATAAHHSLRQACLFSGFRYWSLFSDQLIYELQS